MTAITEFATRDELMQAAASRITEALNRAIAERGEAAAALSGGATPEPAYHALAALQLAWPKMTFLLVDERFVPPAREASNEALLRRTLAPALDAGAGLLPMYSSGATLTEAADRANAAYARQRIDIAVMGMGGDGHTASWFPQSSELSAALDPGNPRTVIAVNAPGAAGSDQRLTLTRSALAKAGKIVLIIIGQDKRKLLGAPRAKLPVGALLELPTEILWTP